MIEEMPLPDDDRPHLDYELAKMLATNAPDWFAVALYDGQAAGEDDWVLWFCLESGNWAPLVPVKPPSNRARRINWSTGDN